MRNAHVGERPASPLLQKFHLHVVYSKSYYTFNEGCLYPYSKLHEGEIFMPYKSNAQRRWAHTKAGKKALGAKHIKKYDKLAKGKNLPEKVKHKKR